MLHLKLNIHDPQISVFGKLEAFAGSSLHDALSIQSTLSSHELCKAFSPNTRIAIIAESKDVFFDFLKNEILQSISLADEHALDTRRNLVNICNMALNACDSTIAVASVQDANNKMQGIVVSSRLAGDLSLIDGFKKGIEVLVGEISKFTRIIPQKTFDKKMQSDDFVNLNYEGITITGIPLNDQLEVRYLIHDGKILLYIGSNYRTLIECIDRIRNNTASLLDEEWFQKSILRIPKQTGFQAIVRLYEKDYEGLIFYSRSLDGNLDFELGIPASILWRSGELNYFSK